jgi:hypothetical protein
MWPLRTEHWRGGDGPLQAVSLAALTGVAGADTSPMADLAERLRLEGRPQDAVLIFEHLLALCPDDEGALRGLVAALGSAGRTLEALHRLMAVKAMTRDVASLLDLIREQSLPAVARFNAHVAAGQIEEAERYASALAALIPQGADMLNAAMACNQALGRPVEAARYARALLALDPAHAGALAALATPERAPEEAAAQAMAEDDRHPLVQLRDLHDAASAILCRPLTDEGAARVEDLLAAARALDVQTEEGSEWRAWERHYRALMQGVDLKSVYGATPDAGPEPPQEFASASGAPLNGWAAVRAAARRVGARVVFFAAADERYVDLYARWYALSVLKHCEVPCLVMIHVIGGAARLEAIAARVGVDDPRLVFTADDFDAGAVRIRCYDAPPKGLAERPLAHFQSARFLRLGALLEALKLPVFVSDIDLLLQRGVQDLLDRTAGDDVVLNENEGNLNAGSRLTANLVLVRPTANAGWFLGFLRAFLDRALAGEEVTRWIDQLALVMARHHLTVRGENPRLGYFDTSSDINNVMYPSYQEHPFRFLSLYHGFDTSSLEGDPRVLGGTTKPRRRARKR